MQAELPRAPATTEGQAASPSALEPSLTAEQRRALAVSEGDLLLDASAGSGKTSVLVERFARAVIRDGVEVDAMLAITFTEKAAAELRDRIRARLWSLGAREQARATEGAFISTIDGFCARVLRAHALSAGIDPEFSVLDEPDARALEAVAFESALAELAAESEDGTELIASYRPAQLRAAILATYGDLRSRGERLPRLPPFRLPASSQTEQEEELSEEDRRRAERVYGLLDSLLARFGALYERRKRECSGLDFADLELLVRDLFASEPQIRERYARRFDRVMVDELQDVNAVQLQLIESVARQNLFAVGDAQQSIYGFRHADVALFERLGERLGREGRRLTLQMNFRSRPELLGVVNRAFAAELGERFRELHPGRTERTHEPGTNGNGGEGGQPRVELMIVDKNGGWPAEDAIYSPWRVAEARALASRVRALASAGARPREIVILTRATTDLRCYERALEEQRIPTYVIGGRGYWTHPQVIDLLAYLHALANPREEEALLTVLASPLVGVSLDALVLLAAAARDAGKDPWWTASRCLDKVVGLAAADRRRIAHFAAWFAAERALCARASVEELIERVLEETDYDLYMLSLAGGERRLANVRKLMRLGREHAAAHGADLRAFLEFVRERAAASGGADESEAPVEGEALDAVRLMTIHRAKGLEFEIVCVADLGRETPRRRSSDILRVGADGRVGLRLARPGSGRSIPVLDHQVLCEEAQADEEAEERRIFYVAMTRARERLIVSGAAKLEADGSLAPNGRGAPIGWIARALQEAGVTPETIRPPSSEDEGAPPAASPAAAPASGAASAPGQLQAAAPAQLQLPLVAETRAEPLPALSYSSLTEYQRCGYRFYMERVLGVPPLAAPAAAVEERLPALPGFTAVERGLLAHELLAAFDFTRPARPEPEAVDAAARRAGLSVAPQGEGATSAASDEVVELVLSFAASPLAERLANAAWVRREERFAFLLERRPGEDHGPVITGVLDAIAGEPDGRVLIVDYKSDRLESQDLERLVADSYATQRLIYALAALRAGAHEVEVAHAFLERPERAAVAVFSRSDLGRLERELAELARGVLRWDFTVSSEPRLALCHGCPAEGGLCPWPLERTRRQP